MVLDGLILTDAKQEEAPSSTPPSTPAAVTLPMTLPAPTAHHSTALLNHIQIHLLPLLLEEGAIQHMDEIFSKNFNKTGIKNALSVVGSIQEEKEKRLLNILQTDQLKLSPNTITNTAKFPKLWQYGIPLDDQRVLQLLLQDIYFVHKCSSIGPATSILSRPLPSGKQQALILIPQAKTYKEPSLE